MQGRIKIIPDAKAIAKTRILAGMSKSDVAKAANIPHSSIVRAELGQGVAPKTAAGISKALGVHFEELFTIVMPNGGRNHDSTD